MFSEKERRCFQYADGTGQDRWADPLKVRRIMLRETGGLLDATWEKAAEMWRILRMRAPEHDSDWKRPPVTPEMIACEDILLSAARKAFNLPAFDPATGGGSVDSDVITVLRSWSAWVGKCAAAGGSGQTSAAPTDSGLAGASPTPGSSPST